MIKSKQISFEVTRAENKNKTFFERLYRVVFSYNFSYKNIILDKIILSDAALLVQISTNIHDAGGLR